MNPAERSPFDVWRELAAERGVTTPAVVFECVGAAGLLQNIVESCDMGTRIFAAGGWYTGDTLDCTKATHKGVTIQFGGGPLADDWYGTLDAVLEGGSTRCRASARSSASTTCPKRSISPARRRGRPASSSTPTVEGP